MLGFSAVSELTLGGMRATTAPEPEPGGSIDITTIPASRRVVFAGGTRVVVFDGVSRTVVFAGGTRTVRF